MQTALWTCSWISPISTIFHCCRGFPIPQAEYPAFKKKKKKKNHSTHVWAFKVFLGNIPSGLRRACLPVREKKKRSDGLLFSLIGWPHSLWNFGFSFTWLSVTSVLSSQQSDKDLALLRYDKRSQRAQCEDKEVPASCLPQSRQFLQGKGL